ncbi:MAG TPA: hypothetical protein PLX89_02085 [Verrucomicrobiota bacterium]|nr:hypothetical protein [Verrucomicrobiales bacterium]HRI11768.1 hypothetical protein [Verrucomicrobiota bacterium]
MNRTLRSFTLAAALGVGLAFTTVAAENAADQPQHAHKHLGGPNGGRLLETQPRAEFFVEKDRRVIIRFYNEDLKPVAASEQTVTVIAEAKSGKVKIEFAKDGDALRSQTTLPEGDGYNLVVQVRPKAGVKPQNFRFKLDLATCQECQRLEYACTCEH